MLGIPKNNSDFAAESKKNRLSATQTILNFTPPQVPDIQ
jgi:hypothetical protein